jgi:hypothetical protein
MKNRSRARALALLAATLCQAAALGADDAQVNKQLTAVVAAQHLPCGTIVHVAKQAEQDYLIACKDGSNYQVTANSSGELVAHSLGQKTR